MRVDPASQGRFSRADVDKAVPVFTQAGRAMRDAGLRFLYHVHGYEFQQGPGRHALRRAREADRAPASWTSRWTSSGSCTAAAIPSNCSPRTPTGSSSTHLKDMKKATKVGEPTGSAPDDTSVALGEGMVDIPGILRAANKAGVKMHFIEDEHPQSEKQIPRSLAYLASLKP